MHVIYTVKCVKKMAQAVLELENNRRGCKNIRKIVYPQRFKFLID